jgi:hypothetical protein
LRAPAGVSAARVPVLAAVAGAAVAPDARAGLRGATCRRLARRQTGKPPFVAWGWAGDAPPAAVLVRRDAREVLRGGGRWYAPLRSTGPGSSRRRGCGAGGSAGGSASASGCPHPEQVGNVALRRAAGCLLRAPAATAGLRFAFATGGGRLGRQTRAAHARAMRPSWWKYAIVNLVPTAQATTWSCSNRTVQDRWAMKQRYAAGSADLWCAEGIEDEAEPTGTPHDGHVRCAR